MRLAKRMIVAEEENLNKKYRMKITKTITVAAAKYWPNHQSKETLP